MSADSQTSACVVLFEDIPVGNVEARPDVPQTRVTLSHLDRRLLVDAEEGDIGHTDEGPLLVGPEHDDGSSLWGLGRDVKVGEANAAQVRGQTYEDVPSTV